LTKNEDDELTNVAQVFAIMRDGIARRENEIKRLAYWDVLTALPNRSQFTFLLKQAIEQHRHAEHTGPENSCYVVMMDLDRFKQVNDIMGHSFGDLMLKRVADILCEALPGTHLARLGGDEFALLLPNSNRESAQNIAKTILRLLELPITIEEQAIDLGAGIGIAGYPADGDNAELVLSRAEVAMYAAKRNLGSNFAMYSPEIDHGSQQNLSLVSELRSAIRENQLRLYLQPKFDLKEMKVVGAEALVRWVHPVRGFLVPDRFILFAEQTGIIRLLTKWVLEKSVEFCQVLSDQGITLKISVNVSSHDLLDAELPNKFAEILQRYDVQASSICLEITESAIMNDPIRAQSTLERLSAMGAELSIDDFGTGYSSLAYLKRLPVNELKIDKSFVQQINHDDDDRTIVKSTIDLGHNMGKRVVAEGVETPEAMQLLQDMQCDQAQGNYIAEAIPAEQFVTWCQNQRSILGRGLSTSLK
jgi:diguanylate cyclase (GGDEF)-like protein